MFFVTRGARGRIAAVLIAATATGVASVSCGGNPRVVTQPVPVPAQAEIGWSLFLIGDAGGSLPDDPVLGTLREMAAVAPDRSTILFLGDNLYPHGLDAEESPERSEQEGRLRRLIDVATLSGAATLFVPGNHDWKSGGEGGLENILRQGAFIAVSSEGRAEQVPANGCPGPAIRDVGGTEMFRLIALDTQWWLHVHDKPVGLSRGCGSAGEEDVIARLEAAVSTAGERHVLVFGHHPLVSGGKHGGHFTVMNHLFPLRDLASWAWLPLPIIGSIYPLARMSGIASQDVNHPKNRVMREAIEAGISGGVPLAYVSGHEHNLQVLEGSSARWLLVSGTGYYDHTDHSVWLAQTRYAASESGFMRVDALRSGRVRLSVVVVEADGSWHEGFSTWLQ